MADPTVTNEQKIAEAAMSNPNIPRIYVNGFVAGFTHSDVFVVLQSGVSPVAVLQMSFNVSKTLGVTLSQTMTEFEEKIGQNILTIQEVRKKLDESEKEST